MTLTFLIAYLFYNDGIQTVIYAASDLRLRRSSSFDQSVLIATILLIQFVAFGGALFFGRLAAKHGAYRSILWGSDAWMVIVVVALFLPEKNVVLFLALGGGHRHRARRHPGPLPVVLQPPHPARPRGRVLRLYNATERGTSWFGTLLFGVVFQITDSYRPAIVALIIFFILGACFLLRVDPGRGIREAGNDAPPKV